MDINKDNDTSVMLILMFVLPKKVVIKEFSLQKIWFDVLLTNNMFLYKKIKVFFINKLIKE